MDMIGHQHISVKLDSGFLQALSKPMEISLVVFIGKEASRAVMAALDDVMWVVGNVQTGASWHALSLAQKLNRAWPL